MITDWYFYHPQMTLDHLGYIPGFFDESDPRSAKEQLQSRYIGGWYPFGGFKMSKNTRSLNFPGDPPMILLAECRLHDEKILFYQHSWLVIMQPDGTWEAAHCD